MAFCKYCGASLAEGQQCTCAQAQAAAAQAAAPAAAQPQAASQATATAVAAAKSVKPYLTEYFLSPVNAVKGVVTQNNMTMAIVLTVIRAVAMGLAIYGLLRSVCKTALSAIAQMSGYLGGSSMLGASISPSLVSCLLYGALFALVGMALHILLVFVIAKLLHSTVSIATVFQADAANGIVVSALFLLAFLCSFVSPSGWLLCMAAAFFAWIVFGVLTAQLVCPGSDKFLFWLIYLVGVLLAIFVGWKILPGLFLKAVGAISISAAGQTMTLQSAIDMAVSEFNKNMASEGGLGGLISEGLGSLFRGFMYDLF